MVWCLLLFFLRFFNSNQFFQITRFEIYLNYLLISSFLIHIFLKKKKSKIVVGTSVENIFTKNYISKLKISYHDEPICPGENLKSKHFLRAVRGLRAQVCLNVSLASMIRLWWMQKVAAEWPAIPKRRHLVQASQSLSLMIANSINASNWANSKPNIPSASYRRTVNLN